MKGITLTTALLGLLVSCLSVSSNPAVFYQPITGEQLTTAQTTVINTLVGLLQDELTALNDTINSLTPLVSSCLTSIEEEESACTQCINTTCQARVDSLSCTTVQPLPRSSCSPALCQAQLALAQAQQGVATTISKVKVLANKVIGGIKDGVNKAINTIGDGLKTAGESIKNVAEKTAAGVKNTAEKVVSGVENAAKEVGKTIVNGLDEAGKAIGNVVKDGVNVVKDGANKVKDFFDGIGRKRRQAQTEPDCDAFETDETACLYYRSQCQSCSALGTSETEPNVTQLIMGVCGQAQKDNYINFERAFSRIDRISEIAANFAFLELKFNPTSWSSEEGGYTDVVYMYGMADTNFTATTSKANNPYVPSSVGPVIAGDVFDTYLPVAA